VNALPDPIALALTQSMTVGQEFVPTDLLTTINADPNPTSVLNDMDRGNAHFEAMQRDFGFLHISRITQKSPSAQEQERLAALMRWLRREFREWSLATDRDCHTLAAMFVITAHCSQQGNLWPDFFASSSVNPEIVAELSKRIAHLQFTFSPNILSRTPISDKDILDRFNVADREGDWVTVASEWPRLGDFLFPDAFLSQAVCYLQAFACDALRAAMEQVIQIVPVMLLMSSLSVADSLALAIASTNPYVQFGSLLRLFQQQRRRNESISQTEEDLLAKLLIIIAADTVQWQQWMLALNRYPIRYPQIQRSLGRVLAEVPNAALQHYISAVILTTTGIGRSTVAECLRTFRSVASLDRRMTLWTLAHERWLQWRFGEHESTETLMNIGSCELDYAIVGYALECMNAEQLNERCATLMTDLSLIDEIWHTSAIEFIQTVSHNLSAFQPYAYARQTGANDDWLMAEGRYILPFDPQTERYKAMFYRIHYMIPGLNSKKA